MATIVRKLLSCVLCEKKFSESDIENLEFFPEQMICFSCYEKGRKKDHRTWCFGKKNVTGSSGNVVLYGYDPQASLDCRKYCPDRKVCFLFASGKIKTLRSLTRKRLPFTRGSVESRAFAAAVLGTTYRRLKRLILAYNGEVLQVLRLLKRGRARGQTWKYTRNEDGRVRITTDD